jgi:hypothetical protein
MAKFGTVREQHDFDSWCEKRRLLAGVFSREVISR